MQVSGSKFTLSHGFVVLCSNVLLVLCWYWYILHASDRNLSLDVIGLNFVTFKTTFLGQLMRNYSFKENILSNGVD